MTETTTQIPLPPIPANWFPLKVGPNPAKRESSDPAFAVQSHDGWPVCLFFSAAYAEWFAAAANALRPA